ncbi:hypothetical protein HHM26_10215, partial [Staphylococcus capitis]|nr:hypothetical protein [Staphylococcus capitis]
MHEAAGGSLLQDNLLTEPPPSKLVGCFEILLNRIAVARAKECCKARQGKARQGKARQGKARQGKGKARPQKKEKKGEERR